MIPCVVSCRWSRWDLIDRWAGTRGVRNKQGRVAELPTGNGCLVNWSTEDGGKCRFRVKGSEVMQLPMCVVWSWAVEGTARWATMDISCECNSWPGIEDHQRGITGYYQELLCIGHGGGEPQLLQNQNKEQIISLQIKKEQSEGMLENSRSLSSECQSKTNNDFKIRYGKQSGRYGKSWEVIPGFYDMVWEDSQPFFFSNAATI